MKRTLIILLALMSIGAVWSEIGYINQYPLKIICPKCGFTFYNCIVDELFDQEYIGPEICMAAQDGVSELLPGNNAICPIDATYPYQSFKNGDKFFTNKGWMPTRRRP